MNVFIVWLIYMRSRRLKKPQELRASIFQTAALCLAIGIDPKRSILFIQSDVTEHGQLAWILNCYAYMGELRRMTQFKDKSGSAQEESIRVGLFSYPLLMAADILLYNVHAVPVGEDQRQHLELSRELARRMNNIYGEIFSVPEAILPKAGARIMGLDDATKKMSKSAASGYNYIALNDSPEQIRSKLKSAVTDSGREIRFDEGTKPAVSNLLTIYHLVSGETIAALEARYQGQGYAGFKSDLGDAVVEFLRPMQERYQEFLGDRAGLEDLLREGAKRAQTMAQLQLRRVQECLGLGFR